MATLDKKTGSWRGEVRVRGKRYRRRGFATREFAELWEAQTRVDAQKRDLGLPVRDDVPIPRVFDAYIAHTEKRNRRRVVQQDRSRANKFLLYLQSIDIRNVGELRPYHINNYVDYAKSTITNRGAPPSNRTINLTIETCRKAFAHSKLNELISSNVFESFKPLTTPKAQQPIYFTVDELRELERFAKEHSPHITDAIAVLARTGLRSGELCTLRRRHHDKEGRLIRLDPTDTKAHKARIVPLCETSHDILLKLSLKAEEAGRDYLFATTTGTQQTVDNLYRRFRTVVNRMIKLQILPPKQYTIHCLRKTYITHAILAGNTVSTIMHFVGHEDYQTTKRYLSLVERLKLETPLPY